MDNDLNESGLTPVSFTTGVAADITAPDMPSGITVTDGSSALYVKWNKNLESDLDGYNLYVDGVKVNTTLIKNEFYTIPDLTNGDSYLLKYRLLIKMEMNQVKRLLLLLLQCLRVCRF